MIMMMTMKIATTKEMEKKGGREQKYVFKSKLQTWLVIFVAVSKPQSWIFRNVHTFEEILLEFSEN